MRTLILTLLVSTLALAPASAEEPVASDAATSLPTVDELLAKVDANMTFESRSTTIVMTVVNPRRTRVYEMRTYGRGASEAAIEYLAPAREKGTRMLKKADEMWMYLPAIERTQKLSGHMLRQGMMGSDLSYEDMMEAEDWRGAYDGTVSGIEEIGGRPHYKVELIAKDDTVSYPKRVSWIDAETLIPTRQELYALSGMLLKRWEMSDVQAFGDRQFPMKMKIQDMLQEGTHTEIEMRDMQFGVELADEVFSTRWLERG